MTTSSFTVCTILNPAVAALNPESPQQQTPPRRCSPSAADYHDHPVHVRRIGICSCPSCCAAPASSLVIHPQPRSEHLPSSDLRRGAVPINVIRLQRHQQLVANDCKRMFSALFDTPETTCLPPAADPRPPTADSGPPSTPPPPVPPQSRIAAIYPPLMQGSKLM